MCWLCTTAEAKLVLLINKFVFILQQSWLQSVGQPCVYLSNMLIWIFFSYFKLWWSRIQSICSISRSAWMLWQLWGEPNGSRLVDFFRISKLKHNSCTYNIHVPRLHSSFTSKIRALMWCPLSQPPMSWTNSGTSCSFAGPCTLHLVSQN